MSASDEARKEGRRIPDEAGTGELSDRDLDKVAGGVGNAPAVVRKPTVGHIRFDGVEGESTHQDHKGE